MNYSRNTWEQWEIEWDLALNDVYLSVGDTGPVYVGQAGDVGSLLAGNLSRAVFAARGRQGQDYGVGWHVDGVRLTLTLIPEPTTLALLLIGLAGVALRRR